MNKLALVASAALILSAVACDRNDDSPSIGSAGQGSAAQSRQSPSTQPGAPAAGSQSAQNAPRSDVTPGAPGQPSPSAGQDNRTAQLTFESVDTDKDGSVSRTEASSIEGLDFATADADNNSSLSRQEFQTAMATARPRG